MHEKEPTNVIEWNEKARTGVPIIDEQHLQMTYLINKLCQAISARRPLDTLRPHLDELDAYARLHFATEEQLMREHGVPELAFEAHARDHRDFIERLELIRRDLEAGAPSVRMDLWQFGAKWWNLHALTIDKKIGHAVNANHRDDPAE